MNIINPKLFVEINEINYIFVVGAYDKNQNFRIIEKLITRSEGLNINQITNVNLASEIIKREIEKIEKKIDHIFNDVIIIIDNFNHSCVNISGFKKLNGSQVLKENISYILNSIKLTINKNEKKKNILHIFNSKSVLDGSILENLPIGLFGDFYVHELSFFLIKEIHLKNINQIFSKNNLVIKKVFLKSFSEGVQLINKENVETFFKVNIGKENSKINFFDDASFKYSESFSFGSDIIFKDIMKICSIKFETISSFLNSKKFDHQNLNGSDFIEEEYFINENYRKIRKKLILDIVNARIEEIANILFNKNINIKSFKKNNINFFINIEEGLIKNNFKKIFETHLLKNTNHKLKFIDNIPVDELIINTEQLATYGWKKEAIPIVQKKNSLITRIFKYIFG
tara:strand:+ start:295 stop:1491 length:1197 start_codon:yes stop_codon:yes gene_type:complete